MRTRRNFLRGAGGVCVGLPLLPSLVPRARAGGAEYPLRLVIFAHQQGTLLDQWIPASVGPLALSPMLEALAPVQQHLTVISGMHNGVHPIIGNSGHGVAESTLLSSMPMVTNILPDGTIADGYPPYSGAAGPSIDQVIAERLGPVTPYKTIDLAMGGGDKSSLHFAGPDDPVTFEPDPRAAFDRLFADLDVDDPSPLQQLRNARASVLDGVSQSFAAVRERAAVEDRARLDAHADKIRALEERFALPPLECGQPTLDLPTDYTPGDDQDDVTAAAMIEIATMALACDMTRVASLVFTSGHTPGFPFLGMDFAQQFPELGFWHELVHAVPGRPDVAEVCRECFGFYTSQFLALVQALAAVPEGDGTMLDHSLVLWVTEFGDGAAHSSTSLPVVLAGSAGGQLQTGRHLDGSGHAFGDLLVSILQLFGHDDTSFGWPESTSGPLPGLV
jgi:hypothetical protein